MTALRHQPWAQGPIDFSIGLKPIPLDAWFEGEETDAEIAVRKGEVMARAAELAWAETEGSREGQAEALALIAAWRGVSSGAAGDPPLLSAARLVSDDLCLMQRRADGWALAAASLCAPTFFTAQEAVGRSLASLHDPVPGFGGRFLARVSRIFDALQPDVVVERRNWTVLNCGELFLPDPAPVRARIPDIRPGEIGRALHVRVERQTLRRLPPTGGVLFTIRVWRWPLEALQGEDRAAFARAWETASDDFRAYKKLALYDDLVAAWLAEGL